MIRRLILVFLLGISAFGFSQKGFVFPEGVSKDKISFKLINNLVIIPAKVNGVKLTFLLDTGVNNTIIFSLAGIDSLALNNPKAIKIKGLGAGKQITGYASSGNFVEVGKARDSNHKVHVVLDNALNLSKRMGIPIHGILGYDFFKDFIVETRYGSEKLIIYSPAAYVEKNCKKCVTLPLIFNNNKPYIPAKINTDTQGQYFLLDSGSSDALWLFDSKGLLTENPKNYFEDYLGSGLSGHIYGKRSKIKSITLGKFTLKNNTVAFPDTLTFKNVAIFNKRKGSIGGEILKRFTVLIDYTSKKIILKKNGKFKEPFHYNMSGLTIEHEGVEVVKEVKTQAEESLKIPDDRVSIPLSKVYTYLLVPKYVVAQVVKDSPADLAGIQKGDEVLAINGKNVYHYKLAELIYMFSSREGKRISMLIKRDNKISKKKFFLKERI